MQMSDGTEQNWTETETETEQAIRPRPPTACRSRSRINCLLFAFFFFFTPPPGIFLPHFECRKVGVGEKALPCPWFEIFNCLVLRLDATRIKNIYPQTHIHRGKKKGEKEQRLPEVFEWYTSVRRSFLKAWKIEELTGLDIKLEIFCTQNFWVKQYNNIKKYS